MRTCRVCGLTATNDAELPLFVKSNCNKHGRKPLCNNCHNTLQAAYYEDSIAEIKLRKKAHYEANSSKLIHKQIAYQKVRLERDENYKLICTLRDRLRKALKHNSKMGSAVQDLGCSIAELKDHLSKTFSDTYNVTFNFSRDYNSSEHHIDHILPLISFNLEDSMEFKKAVHYSNLQLLTAKDNLSKGAKLL